MRRPIALAVILLAAGVGARVQERDKPEHFSPLGFEDLRAYVQAYLDAHPRIHRGLTCMVRQLASGPQGIPLELYCFTDTVAWAEYEAIQADIFDHLFALLPEFGLRLYQQPSGYDMQAGLVRQDEERAESPLLQPATP